MEAPGAARAVAEVVRPAPAAVDAEADRGAAAMAVGCNREEP